MKKDRKKKKAFTLVELIASIAIFGLISVVAISMISYGLKLSITNRKIYDADVYSKTFFELIRNNRPTGSVSGVLEPVEFYTGYGRYDSITPAHNSKDYIKVLVNDIKNRTNKTGLVDYDDESVRLSKLDESEGDFVILVKMQWDGKLYSVESWAYDIKKGVLSEIYRKTLIAP